MKEPFYREETSEITICNTCRGRGIVEERVSAYDHEAVTCKRCNGLGRVLKRFVITYETLEL